MYNTTSIYTSGEKCVLCDSDKMNAVFCSPCQLEWLDNEKYELTTVIGMVDWVNFKLGGGLDYCFPARPTAEEIYESLRD